MQLTEKDIKLFEALENSRIGDRLVDYLERLNNWLCDIRNMDGVEETKRQARLEFSHLLKLYLIDKIKVGNRKKETTLNEYE